METMHAVGRRRLPPVPVPAAERRAAGQVVAGTSDEPDTDQFATQVIDTGQLAAELIEAELAALAEAGADDADADADADDAADADDGEADAADVVDETVDDEAADDQTADELDATAQLQLSELAALMADDDAPTEEEPEQDLPGSRPAQAATELPEAPTEIAVDEQDPAQQFVARLRSSAADFAAAAGADSAVVREAVPPARHRRARCRLVLRFADGDLVDVTLLGPAGAPGRPSRHGFDRQILRWLGAGLVQDDAWLVDDPDAPGGVAVDLSAWVAGG